MHVAITTIENFGKIICEQENIFQDWVWRLLNAIGLKSLYWLPFDKEIRILHYAKLKSQTAVLAIIS